MEGQDDEMRSSGLTERHSQDHDASRSRRCDKTSASGFLFSSVNGGLLRHSNTYVRFFEPALVEAGLDQALRFHDLRHSATSVAGSRHYGDQSAKVVQALLGHSSQQVTTEIYTHIFPEELETLKDKLEVIYRDVFEEEGQIHDSRSGRRP